MPHDNLIANILPHLSIWWDTLVIVLAFLGVLIFIGSLAKLAGRERSWGRIFLALASGVLLINLPSFLDSLAFTIFSENSVLSLSYRPPEHPAKYYIQFAIFVVALVGLIGIGRGIILLKDSGSQPGQLGRALVHIFGGILCVNFVSTLKIMGRSLGGDVLDVIVAIVG
jgi:hypothetical protein